MQPIDWLSGCYGIWKLFLYCRRNLIIFIDHSFGLSSPWMWVLFGYITGIIRVSLLKACGLVVTGNLDESQGQHT